MCEEIDECSEQPDICAPGTCHNQPAGAHTCVCPAGYMATEVVGGACADIDECQLGACPAGAACRNTPGGYDCQCRRGFRFRRGDNLCEGRAGIINYGIEPRFLDNQAVGKNLSVEIPYMLVVG